jgi:hypothetical protein
MDDSIADTISKYESPAHTRKGSIELSNDGYSLSYRGAFPFPRLKLGTDFIEILMQLFT